jgi:hypothetical protein
MLQMYQNFWRKQMMGITTMKKVLSTLTAAGFGLIALAFPAQATTPSISPTTKAQLIYIIQEEKLARDVYAALATAGISQKFSNIMPSEQTHIDLIAGLMKTYGVTNPITGLKAGVFKDYKLTPLYKTVMTKAALSPADAIAVGVLIENTDIADLNTMLKTIVRTDIRATLGLLLSGSEKHLAAFSR